MPEPVKNMFRPETVATLATWLDGAGAFDRAGFLSEALDGLDDLELKDRVRHLAGVVHRHLPAPFR